MEEKKLFDQEIHEMLTLNAKGLQALQMGWNCGNDDILRGMLSFLDGAICTLENRLDLKRKLGEILFWFVADEAVEHLKMRRAVDVDEDYEFAFETRSGRLIYVRQAMLDPEIRGFFDAETGKEIHNTASSVEAWLADITTPGEQQLAAIIKEVAVKTTLDWVERLQDEQDDHWKEISFDIAVEDSIRAIAKRLGVGYDVEEGWIMYKGERLYIDRAVTKWVGMYWFRR